jgi:hypothetical protein
MLLSPAYASHLILSRSSTLVTHSNLPLFFTRTSNASLPSQSFWSKFKGSGGKSNRDADMRGQPPQMSLSRQRLLTLVYGDMETVRMVRIIPLPLAVSQFDAVWPAAKYLRSAWRPAGLSSAILLIIWLSRNWTLSPGTGRNLRLMLSSASASQLTMCTSRLLWVELLATGYLSL